MVTTTVVEVHDPVGGGGRLGVVRRHDDGRTRGRPGPQQAQHHLAVGVVELGGGLVGEQHRALEGEPAGHRDALLLAAGELLDEVLVHLGQAEGGERGGGPPRGPARVGPPGEQREQHVLVGGEHRREPVALRDERDAGRDRRLEPVDLVGRRRAPGPRRVG